MLRMYVHICIWLVQNVMICSIVYFTILYIAFTHCLILNDVLRFRILFCAKLGPSSAYFVMKYNLFDGASVGIYFVDG